MILSDRLPTQLHSSPQTFSTYCIISSSSSSSFFFCYLSAPAIYSDIPPAARGKCTSCYSKCNYTFKVSWVETWSSTVTKFMILTITVHFALKTNNNKTIKRTTKITFTIWTKVLGVSFKCNLKISMFSTSQANRTIRALQWASPAIPGRPLNEYWVHWWTQTKKDNPSGQK